jgi:hypothetical protein
MLYSLSSPVKPKNCLKNCIRMVVSTSAWKNIFLVYKNEFASMSGFCFKFMRPQL